MKLVNWFFDTEGSVRRLYDRKGQIVGCLDLRNLSTVKEKFSFFYFWSLEFALIRSSGDNFFWPSQLTKKSKYGNSYIIPIYLRDGDSLIKQMLFDRSIADSEQEMIVAKEDFDWSEHQSDRENEQSLGIYIQIFTMQGTLVGFELSYDFGQHRIAWTLKSGLRHRSIAPDIVSVHPASSLFKTNIDAVPDSILNRLATLPFKDPTTGAQIKASIISLPKESKLESITPKLTL